MRCTFVLATHRFSQLLVFGGNLQPRTQCLQRLDAALLVHDVARPFLRRGQALAEVVGEGRETDQVIARRQPGSHVADHFLVDAGIDLGVEFGTLWHAIQRFQLGQDRAQCMRIVQCAQERGGPLTDQRLAQLLPDALGHQRVQLATGGDLAHQCHGLFGDGEAQWREARHEARARAQQIFHERRADMAQHALLDIAHTAVGIDQRAGVFVAGNRVDGEVAALQVLLSVTAGSASTTKPR